MCIRTNSELIKKLAPKLNGKADLYSGIGSLEKFGETPNVYTILVLAIRTGSKLGPQLTWILLADEYFKLLDSNLNIKNAGRIKNM